MSLKIQSQKQHWITPSLFFPKAWACSPPTSRDVLLQKGVRRDVDWVLSPFLVILAYVSCSCILYGSLQLWHNACACAPSCTEGGRDGKKRSCKDLVFKLICLIFAWIEECLYEQPGWLDIASSCGTCRAVLQLQKDVSAVPHWAELSCLLPGCPRINTGLGENGKKR